MTLTLTITKHPELPPGEAMSRTFERCNAVIGRGADSDWMLPDPERHLSKQHCRIEFRGDRYVAAVDVNGYDTTHLLYLARAVTPGTYRVPPPQVESMYRPGWKALGAAPAQLVVKGR